MAAADSQHKVVARNRRARYEYEIIDTLEAGIVLVGPEVKSLREGRASMGDAYAVIQNGELFLKNLHISKYEPATRSNVDPVRERKLLVHRSEIAKLSGRVVERGFTLVPLCLYFKDGRAKVELALARGKHRYDKRQALRKRDDEREKQRALRARGRTRR